MNEANNPNDAFLQAHDEIEAMYVAVIPKEQLWSKLTTAETTGLETIAGDPSKVVSFANIMREICGRALEANVQPPYTDLERNQLLGKITTYTALSETGIKPAKAGPTETKPLRNRPAK